jgi:acetate kinase
VTFKRATETDIEMSTPGAPILELSNSINLAQSKQVIEVERTTEVVQVSEANVVGVKRDPFSLLTINGGSSSVKFALYQVGEPLQRVLYGQVDRIGMSGTNLTFTDSQGKCQPSINITANDHKSTVSFLMDWLGQQKGFELVRAVGHRVVHGMKHTEPEVITRVLLDELHRISPYDPEHMPREIEMIEAFCQKYPNIPQIACFDTTFHVNMPRVAKLLPIPRRYEMKGLQRYGFHGLSYGYLVEELVRLGDPAATSGRVILAHLGNGASMAAVLDGHGIDTSMGFTPTAGLVMGTRSGDLDPGMVSYLARTEQITISQVNKMINQESGLLGVSETSSDMRDLLECEKDDVRAAEAVDLFCYQAKKWIGSFAAALGGLDTLVFAGGIGENSADVRARICRDLKFLGVELNDSLNAEGAAVISEKNSRINVRVIHTDEELMIARSVIRVLHLDMHSRQQP